jgi:hypothetical protein
VEPAVFGQRHAGGDFRFSFAQADMPHRAPGILGPCEQPGNVGKAVIPVNGVGPALPELFKTVQLLVQFRAACAEIEKLIAGQFPKMHIGDPGRLGNPGRKFGKNK